MPRGDDCGNDPHAPVTDVAVRAKRGANTYWRAQRSDQLGVIVAWLPCILQLR